MGVTAGGGWKGRRIRGRRASTMTGRSREFVNIGETGAWNRRRWRPKSRGGVDSRKGAPCIFCRKVVGRRGGIGCLQRAVRVIYAGTGNWGKTGGNG